MKTDNLFINPPVDPLTELDHFYSVCALEQRTNAQVNVTPNLIGSRFVRKTKTKWNSFKCTEFWISGQISIVEIGDKFVRDFKFREIQKEHIGIKQDSAVSQTLGTFSQSFGLFFSASLSSSLYTCAFLEMSWCHNRSSQECIFYCKRRFSCKRLEA